MHRHSDEYRERIVRLRDDEGLSFPVIAERLGLYSYQARDLYRRQKKKKQNDEAVHHDR